MADMLPKIIETAKKQGRARILCPRPMRMAKELRKHLPDFEITWAGNLVVVARRQQAWMSCSTGPTCAAHAKAGCSGLDARGVAP